MKHFLIVLVFLHSQILFAVGYDKPSKPSLYELKGGSVEFKTTASPNLINIEGKGGSASGELSISYGEVAGELKVKLEGFDTGIALRNKHMKEKYLEVEKYPEATLSFKGVPDKPKGEFSATLQVKKDAKLVKVTYEIKDNTIYAKFDFEVKDFPSIGVPSYLGVTAASTVSVSVELPFKR